jgi:hypothetical protein
MKNDYLLKSVNAFGDLFIRDWLVGASRSKLALTKAQWIPASDNDIPEEEPSINNPQCLEHENFDQ